MSQHPKTDTETGSTFDPAFDAAVRAARQGASAGGVPIGAALTRGGVLLAAGHNERVQRGDPTAHGEIATLRAAGRQKTYRDTTLYTTLAPCMMCTGAILQYKIPRVVIGEAQNFSGEIALLRSRGVEVTVLDDDRCIAMMADFQRNHPDVWAEDIAD